MADSSVFTTDLGAVTAYADAKAHGYTGTREEFATLLANAGNNLAEANAAKAARPDQRHAGGPERYCCRCICQGCGLGCRCCILRCRLLRQYQRGHADGGGCGVCVYPRHRYQRWEE